MQVCELAVHRGRRILERNSDAVILEVRRRLARPCLEGSKSRNRLSETCAWPVLFWVSAKLHHLTKAGTMFNRMLVLGPAALLGAACGIDRPPPYRRDRRFQRDSGVQRRQVLGGRRNGKLEQAGVRPGDGSANARD